jgi:hypothetical protein
VVPPDRPLDYQSVADPPRRLGFVRGSLSALGLIWFALCFVTAVMGFLMRGLGDEPGAPVTVPRALLGSLVIVAFGLPGIAVSIAAHRLGR